MENSKDDVNEIEDTIGVIFSENTKRLIPKNLRPNKIYLEKYCTYNNIMEEHYTTKVHHAKSALYDECNTGVSVIKK